MYGISSVHVCVMVLHDILTVYKYTFWFACVCVNIVTKTFVHFASEQRIILRSVLKRVGNNGYTLRILNRWGNKMRNKESEEGKKLL